MTVVDDWISDSEWYRIVEDERVVNFNDELVAILDENWITVVKDGETALRGRPVELRENNGETLLVVEGTTEPWEPGNVELDDEYVVMAAKHHPEIDEVPNQEDDEETDEDS